MSISSKFFVTLITLGALSGCGKVANLTQAAGLLDYTPAHMKTNDLLPVTAGIDYKEVIGVDGGMLPFQFSLTAGELPKGLDIDLATGREQIAGEF